MNNLEEGIQKLESLDLDHNLRSKVERARIQEYDLNIKDDPRLASLRKNRHKRNLMQATEILYFVGKNYSERLDWVTDILLESKDENILNNLIRCKWTREEFESYLAIYHRMTKEDQKTYREIDNMDFTETTKLNKIIDKSYNVEAMLKFFHRANGVGYNKEAMKFCQNYQDTDLDYMTCEFNMEAERKSECTKDFERGLRILNEEGMPELIKSKQFKWYEQYLGLVTLTAANTFDKEAVEEVIELLPNCECFVRVYNVINQSLHHYPDKTKKISKVLNKFGDKEEIVDFLSDPENYKVLDELLTERAYKEISKNPRNLYKVRNYDTGGLDREWRDSIPYTTLEVIDRTSKMVMSIHKDRKDKQRFTIVEGFYTELNRAANQRDDMKGKIKNITQYCVEVQTQMRDNIDELMVVTNG